MTPRQVALSKAVAHALRHAPGTYRLALDEEGWVPLAQLLEGLHERRRWRGLTEAELRAALEASAKKRFELSGGRIRALYGHSVPTSVRKRPAVPPPVLFHGTSRTALASIRSRGLRPMGRQFVHLSVDADMALTVARRKGPDPVVLTVAAAEAHEAGVEFLRGSDAIWLVDHLPPSFLRSGERPTMSSTGT